MPNINKNIIMQAGAAVANATNKAAGLSAATPEPGSIISAIQLVNGGRTIGPDSLAHFTESVRNKLLSLLVSMKPIQDLNGYDHPWPGGGGKNLIDYLACVGLGPRNNTDSTDVQPTAVDGVLTLTGEASYVHGGMIFKGIGTPTPPTTFTVSAEVKSTSSRIIFGIGAYEGGGSSDVDANFTVTTNTWVKISRTFSNVSYGKLGILLQPQLDADVLQVKNVQVESGSTATAYAPYSNICPISGRTGLNGYIGPTDSIGDAATYSMDWTSPAGTVYAGSADIVSGDIKAAPYYASYNGETLVGPWVSSMDEYDPEGTPTTGAQVVDLGGTMTEYHITGQDIITLVGDNYVWSDSGDVTITE